MNSENSSQFNLDSFSMEKNQHISLVEEYLGKPLNLENIKKIRSLFIDLQYETAYENQENWEMRSHLKTLKNQLIEMISEIKDEKQREKFLFEILPAKKETDEELIVRLNQENAEIVLGKFSALALKNPNETAELVYRLVLHDPEGFLKYFDQEIARKLDIQEEVIDAVIESKPELVAEYFEKIPLSKLKKRQLLEKYSQKHPREFLQYFNNFNLKESQREDYLFKIKLLDKAVKKQPRLFHNLKNEIKLDKPEDKKRFIQEAEQLIIGNIRKEFIKLRSKTDSYGQTKITEDEAREISDIEARLFGNSERLSEKYSSLKNNHINPRNYILLKHGKNSLTRTKKKADFYNNEIEEVTGWKLESFNDIDDPLLNQKIALELVRIDPLVFEDINQVIWKDPKMVLEVIKISKTLSLLSRFTNDYIKYDVIKFLSDKHDYYHHDISLFDLMKYFPKDEKLKRKLLKGFYSFHPQEMFSLALKSEIKLDQDLAKKALLKEPGIYLYRYWDIETITKQKPNPKFPWKKIEAEETKKTYLDDLLSLTFEEKKELTLKAAQESPETYFQLLLVGKAKNLTRFELPIFMELVKKCFEEEGFWLGDMAKILKGLLYSDVPRSFFLECLQNGIKKDIDTFSLEEIFELDLSRPELEPILEMYFNEEPRDLFLDIGDYFKKLGYSETEKLGFCKRMLRDHWKLIFGYERERRSDILLTSSEKLHKELIAELYQQTPLGKLASQEYLEKIVELDRTDNLGNCSLENIELINYILGNYPDEYSRHLEEILKLRTDFLPYMNIEKYNTIIELEKKVKAIDAFNIKNPKVRKQFFNFNIFGDNLSWIIPFMKKENVDLVIEKLLTCPINTSRFDDNQDLGLDSLSDESIINRFYLVSDAKIEEVRKTYDQLFSQEGIIHEAKDELLENFFKTTNAYRELKKCQEIFTNPNLPLHKKLFYFTETYFNEFFESYAQKGEFAKDVKVDEFLVGDDYRKFAALSISEKRACHKEKLKKMSDSEVQELSQFVFKDLVIKFKKKVLEAKIKKTIEYSRSDARKAYADQRNRVLKNINQLAIADTLLHGTSQETISKMLHNGNLAGEAIGATSERDSYPFHADFIQLDDEYIKKHQADFYKCLISNKAYSYAEGKGSVLIFNRNQEFDIYEPLKEFSNDPATSKHFLQYFMLGGIPSTEISGMVIASKLTSAVIANTKEDIVLNGFYIPIYNQKGELVFDENEYENMKTDLNVNNVIIPIFDQAINIGHQLGSNEGGTYLVPEEGKFNKYYFKFAPRERLWNEHLACKFYQELRFSVPDTKVVYWDGKLALASRWVEQDENIENEPIIKKKIQDGFIFDCWLGNWDITLNENYQLINNEVFRIDNGGALLFRAMGEDKIDFAEKVGELESLKKRPEFHGISQANISQQVEKLRNKMTDDKIAEIVNYTQLSLKTREKIIGVLIKRRNYIVENYRKLIK